MVATKFVAKTIFKGVASFFGIDLNVNEEDLKKIYESIDLSNNLIILEDLERANIEILEILGFVNNLVEQDGVKVMLVSNESEILKYVENPKLLDKNNDKQSLILDNKSELYLKIKEKTVSDTIIFYSPIIKAIDNIMSKFNNKHFEFMLERKNELTGYSLVGHEIKEQIMDDNSILSQNLRSFIFACQKTCDIFNEITFEADNEYLRSVFFGNIAFCLKHKKYDDYNWEDSRETISLDLGTYRYPLYKFAFDYIRYQYLDVQSFAVLNRRFVNQKELDNNQTELKNLYDIIFAYFHMEEEVVIESLVSISKLIESNKVPISNYKMLANYLIAIKHDINCDEIVDKCKDQMLENIDKELDSDSENYTYYNGIQLESEDAQKEFNEFKIKFDEKIHEKEQDLFNFNYDLKDLDSFIDMVLKEKDGFITKRCFAKKINSQKFINLMKECSAMQIHKIRMMFHSVYSFANINEYFSNDKNNLIELKEEAKRIVEYNDGYFDKIQIKQMNYFINNLTTFINKL